MSVQNTTTTRDILFLLYYISYHTRVFSYIRTILLCCTALLERIDLCERSVGLSIPTPVTSSL